jgi:hypothetical protein
MFVYWQTECSTDAFGLSRRNSGESAALGRWISTCLGILFEGERVDEANLLDYLVRRCPVASAWCRNAILARSEDFAFSTP